MQPTWNPSSPTPPDLQAFKPQAPNPAAAAVGAAAILLLLVNLQAFGPQAPNATAATAAVGAAAVLLLLVAAALYCCCCGHKGQLHLLGQGIKVIEVVILPLLCCEHVTHDAAEIQHLQQGRGGGEGSANTGDLIAVGEEA